MKTKGRVAQSGAWKGRSSTVSVVREAAALFYRRGGPMLGGALAFYATLAIAPMLLLSTVLAGVFLGEVRAHLRLREYLERQLGESAADTVLVFLTRLEDAQARDTATILGVLLLMYAASQLFLQLRRALNRVFGVRLGRPSGFVTYLWFLLRMRGWTLVAACLAVVGMAALLFMNVALRRLAHEMRLDGQWQLAFHCVELFLSSGWLTLVFLVFLRLLPDLRLSWSDLFVGSLVSAILYGICTLLLSVYLASAVRASPYGAIGSIALVLLWLYYSAQTILFGAAFTFVWAQRRGHGVVPTWASKESSSQVFGRKEGSPAWWKSVGPSG